MPRSDHVDAFRGRDNQQFHRSQPCVGTSSRGEAGQRLVDMPHALHIRSQRVEEDARHGMASDLGQAGVARQHIGSLRAIGLLQAAGADGQDAFGSQVQGGGQRGCLAHGAVAEVLGMAIGHGNVGRREHKRNGGRRQQMGVRDGARHRDALGA